MPDQNANSKQNPVKDQGDWVTGGEEPTGPQLSYLKTLAQEANEPLEEDMTKAKASKKIEELQEKTGRGESEIRKEESQKDIPGLGQL